MDKCWYATGSGDSIKIWTISIDGNLFVSPDGHGDLVVRSRLRGQKGQGWKPDSTEDPPSMRACCTQIIRRKPNILLPVWYGCLERRMPAQNSYSSSDLG
ncbi:hypothetical protein AVEN_156905-1 [Araneus ventricosus]|uniref:Uncharacterized protein n=1 Tax=Araneus ventricosus TaxID=182803 RepID=A0A4Y2EN09_ARAVE|nr:hypothetical protein AVEN_156905-1 [Araneus ventricosus]